MLVPHDDAPHDQVVVDPTVFAATTGGEGGVMGIGVKFAVHVLFAFMTIVWLAVPEQPVLPVQLEN